MFFSLLYRGIFPSVAFALLLAGPSLRAENEQPQAADFDLTKFGQLPVRFNGRVTTYDRVAKNYLRRFGDRDVCYDEKEQKHPAVRWMLDVMANRDRAKQWRIFRVENKNLMEQIELEPHTGGKHTRNYFTFAELESKISLIVKALQSASREESQTETYRMLFDLYEDVGLYQTFQTSFRPPTQIDAGHVPTVRAELIMLSQGCLPLFVPAADGKSWRHYYLASLRDLVAKKPEEANPLFRELQAILKAHREKDRKGFQQGIKTFSQSQAAIHAADSPFQFTAGSEWLEVGALSSGELFFYGDANAEGQRVVQMSLPKAGDLQFIVNYFQNQKISSAELVNSWRMTLGLVPLPEAELKKTLMPTQLAGRDALLFDAQTPDDVTHARKKRYVTVLLQEENQTFVLSFFGDRTDVGNHLDTRQALIESFKIKPVKEVLQWFPIERKAADGPPEHVLVAVVPEGRKLWMFYVSGSTDELEKHREQVLTFLKSVKFSQTKSGQLKPKWPLPKSWVEYGELGNMTILLGTEVDAPALTITQLGEADEKSVDAIMDCFAKKVRRGALSKEERDKSLQEFPIGNRKGYLFEIQKKELDHKLSYNAPKGWRKLPPGLLVKHSYEIVQGDDQAKVTIVTLPAQTKDLLPQNINRWRAQIELPTQDEKEVLKATKPIKIDKQPGTFIDLHNPQNKKRILAAVVKHDEKSWYFKMMGASTLVEKERKNFQAFLKSVKLPEKDPAIPSK